MVHWEANTRFGLTLLDDNNDILATLEFQKDGRVEKRRCECKGESDTANFDWGEDGWHQIWIEIKYNYAIDDECVFRYESTELKTFSKQINTMPKTFHVWIENDQTAESSYITCFFDDNEMKSAYVPEQKMPERVVEISRDE